VVEAVALWRRLVGAQVRSQMQYRTSFVLTLIAQFAISFIDFLAIVVIFHNTPRLAEWTVQEVAFLYALSSITFGITDLLIGHFDLVPQLIRNGNFDILLVRPRGTLFQVIASDFQLRRLGKAAQGGVVLVYALSALHVHWTASRVAVLAASIPSGIVIFCSVWVVFGCLVFWTTESGEFTNAFTYGGNYLTQYPIDLYAAWLRRFLAYLVPLAFVCYFPALYVLGKPDPLGLPKILQFLSPVVALLGVVVAGGAWRFAVRHYRSAGG
jgi:viologen exporter family transport system permease protein